MHWLLPFLLLFILTGCENRSVDNNTSLTFVERTAEYHYDTSYDITQEAQKSNRMLVIRLDYADQQFVNSERTWADKIFGTQNHQLNHYMNEVSNNQMNYTPVAEGGKDLNDGVVSVLFLKNHPNPNIDYDSQFHPDLAAAITSVSEYGFDFSLYDDDNNGKITPSELLIIFVMAGEEDAYSGGSRLNGIWAHQNCTSSAYTPNVNGVDVMGCDSGGNFAIFGERHCDYSTTCHDASIGIIAHELGHSALDLPDLYDVYGKSAGIGAFGLMATGSWGQTSPSEYPGETPSHLSAWSKVDVGWINPEIIVSGSGINLVETGSSNYNIIQVTINANEYFLLENRSKTGYDSGLTELLNGTYIGGIAIWHIDSNVIAINRENNTVNTNTSHKGVDLEDANNAEIDRAALNFGHANNLFFNTNKNEFTPDTSPNTGSYITSTGIRIDNISAVKSIMTVDVSN